MLNVESVLYDLKKRAVRLKGRGVFLFGIFIGIFVGLAIPTTPTQQTKVYFSPQDSIDLKLIGEVKNAKSSIDLAIYSFTLPTIAESLIQAHRNGVKVRVLIDKTQASSSTIDELLEAKGIQVLRDSQFGSQHNKFMIIDGKNVFTGSYNYTKNATFRNMENLVLVSNPSVVSRYKTEFEKLWSVNMVEVGK